MKQIMIYEQDWASEQGRYAHSLSSPFDNIISVLEWIRRAQAVKMLGGETVMLLAAGYKLSSTVAQLKMKDTLSWCLRPEFGSQDPHWLAHNCP